MDKTADHKGDIDLTEDEINTNTTLAEALQNILHESRAASPGTPELVSPEGSDDTEPATIIRRNTMSLPTNAREASIAENIPQAPVQRAGFTEGQLVEFVRVWGETNDHKRPKVKPPAGFRGD